MTSYWQALTEMTQDIRTAKVTAVITTLLSPIIAIIPEFVAIVTGAVGVTATIILTKKHVRNLDAEHENTKLEAENRRLETVLLKGKISEDG